MKPAKWDRKRGRHRKHASKETQLWNQTQLIPECPPWLDQESYHQLMKMRAGSERPLSVVSAAENSSNRETPR